jgi:hypothetical protein
MAKLPVSLDKLFRQMNDWPNSWAGFRKDIPYGEQLCAQMKPFVTDLHEQGLSSKTLRLHLANLWAIGGEIIRHINDHPSARKKSPRLLLAEMVQLGEAPLMPNATFEEQRSCDATARKLNKFLNASNISE